MKKKKIAIINPPSPFLINQRVFPNIGVVRVATTLKQNQYHVKLFDFAGDKDCEKIMKNIANDFDYYAFSSTSPQFPYTYKLFKILKKENPNAKTIIGGAHPSAIRSLKDRKIKDKNIKTLNEFDTIFNGEGEDITNMFKKGWQTGKVIKNIDDTVIPDCNLIDLKSYKYNLFGVPTTNIQTQRGCPYKCSFCCGRDIDMYNHVRMHSPKRVLEEMDRLNKQYGFTSFMWYDDEININSGRLENLCNTLSTRPYQHRGFVRSDMIVKYSSSVKWMKDAGFVKLCAGVESGSDRILNLINKKSTYDINLKARQLIKEGGIHYESFLLLGHPSETRSDVELTIQWLKEAKPDDFDINLITPYPGSKIYDEAVRSNKFPEYEWEYKGLYFNKPDYSQEDSYYKGLNGQSKSNIRTDEISNEEYIKLRNEIEKMK